MRGRFVDRAADDRSVQLQDVVDVQIQGLALTLRHRCQLGTRWLGIPVVVPEYPERFAMLIDHAVADLTDLLANPFRRQDTERASRDLLDEDG